MKPLKEARGHSGSEVGESGPDLPVDTSSSGSGGNQERGKGLRTFAASKTGVLGLVFVVGMAGFSFIGPLVYRTNQVIPVIASSLQGPSRAYPLGTDAVGYNVLGRLMVGGQVSLEVGVGAAILTTVIGVVYGMAAALAGGWLDAAMMRLVDAFLAIPVLVVLLVLATIVTPSIPVLIIIISFMSWLPTARITRSECLSLKTREFVQASVVAGSGVGRIMSRHLLRNVAGTVAVLETFAVADAILLLATMSYLGLGPPPPITDWGGMLSSGLNYTYDGYWWLIYPAGVALLITVVGVNFVGDAIRDAMDVRLQER